MMPRLARLALTNFRNYAAMVWHPSARIAVMTGPNGTGKTNLLEAISLLVPGRGLRGARIAELPRIGSGGRWGVAARLEARGETTDLATGSDGDSERRVFRLDGAAPRSQAEIAAHLSAVWLTPQMDRLFLDSASGRCRFLDRLVWALEPSHAREVAAHDTARAQRNRLLVSGPADPAWLSGLEDSLARHAVAITAARVSLITRLNAAMEAAAAVFPPTRLGLLSPIADRLAEMPALAVEDWLRATLRRTRPDDAQAGGTRLGAHRADMTLHHAATGVPAAQASTGQQKAMLIGVVLAHAALITAARGDAPLLLLDEPVVHLDATYRAALFDALRTLPAQTLLTGTDAEVFAPLDGVAEALLTGEGELRPDGRFSAPAARYKLG